MAIKEASDLTLEKAEVLGILVIVVLLVFTFSCVLVPTLLAGHGEHAEHHATEHGSIRGEEHVVHEEHAATAEHQAGHGVEHTTVAEHGGEIAEQHTTTTYVEHAEQVAATPAESHG